MSFRGKSKPCRQSMFQGYQSFPVVKSGNKTQKMIQSDVANTVAHQEDLRSYKISKTYMYVCMYVCNVT